MHFNAFHKEKPKGDVNEFEMETLLAKWKIPSEMWFIKLWLNFPKKFCEGLCDGTRTVEALREVFVLAYRKSLAVFVISRSSSGVFHNFMVPSVDSFEKHSNDCQQVLEPK